MVQSFRQNARANLKLGHEHPDLRVEAMYVGGDEDENI